MFKFDYFGRIFGVAIANSDKGYQQNITPFQIYLGLDYYNRIVPSSSYQVDNYNRSSTIEILNLKPLTDYTFFLVASDDNPGFPTLDDPKFIKVITAKTLEGPKDDFVDLGGVVWRINLLILLFFVN